MEEHETLNVKKIGTQGNMSMVLENGGWNQDGFKGGNSGCGLLAGCLAFEDGNVRAVDEECTTSVGRRNGTITEQVLCQNGLKLGLVGATKLAVQLPRGVGVFDLPMGEKLLLCCYCGHHGVRGNGVTTSVRIIHIQARRMFDKLHDGTVDAVDLKGWFRERIHGHATDFAYLRE